ncbi:Keratin, type I cytoskeletal 18 [Pteropus alecto]|uniref:Keratin, type I cytoskeletal 18 n=1 Tax=Pteropus alecto TaxID=9402 RepID=L5KBC6_PTEAL|nr:Keratin, type I cytoskeletal 18 [Pteropus alecto]
MDNAHIILQIAADDFSVKYETELTICQSVENDINGLQKVIDDSNITGLQLETEIEALKEELLFTKKNHKEEVNGLQNQIANSGLTMELDLNLWTSATSWQKSGPSRQAGLEEQRRARQVLIPTD